MSSHIYVITIFTIVSPANLQRSINFCLFHLKHLSKYYELLPCFVCQVPVSHVFRGVFRILSNISDGAFLKQLLVFTLWVLYLKETCLQQTPLAGLSCVHWQTDNIQKMSLIQEIRLASDIGQKGNQNLHHPYPIPFRQNKVLHNFQKRGCLISGCIKGLG